MMSLIQFDINMIICDVNLSFTFNFLDDDKHTSTDPTNECCADTTHYERFCHLLSYLTK